ncbi:MAG: S9 family peptidase [Bacteroidota bacterium]
MKRSAAAFLLSGLLLLTLGYAPAAAQQATETAELSLESLFNSSTFRGKGFQGGRWAEAGPVVRYTVRKPAPAETGGDATDLMEYNLETDTRTVLIDGSELAKPDGDGLIGIEGYQYSADRSKVLLYTDSERVWRLNTKGYYYVYDLETDTVMPVSDRAEGFQMFAKFNPAGDQVAFVRDRNLFAVDLASGEEMQLTTGGSDGGVINGTFDWVYEEEFGLRDGFQWSPDGQHIAFFQLDETGTRDFQMTDFTTLYPEYATFRYPKAGEVNSEIQIGVIDMTGPNMGATRFFDTDTWNEGGETTEYLSLMGWTPAIDGRHHVWMGRMNRDQNVLDLLYGDPASMALETVLTETSDTWIDVETGFSDLDTGTLTYLDDEAHFVWRSDRTGHSHLYLYRNDGTFVRQLTGGDWDVTTFHGIDEGAGALYVTATKESPMERHLYRVPFAMEGTSRQSAEPVKITDAAGWHSAETSGDLRYYVDRYSNVSTPPVTSLHRIDGSLVKVLEANEELIATVQSMNLAPVEFMTVPAADGTDLNAYLITPSDFDPREAHPMLIHTYGGPGSQEVRNAWGGTERLWHYMLAEEHGILVAGVDNRGTGGRGKRFKAQTYKRLGPLEAEDQIAAAQHFGQMDWVDADRLGIWGWSYGGYLTLLAMLYEDGPLDGPETFKLGVSVAPVTNWRLYDTIYTERYLSTPQKNPDGYDLGSPVTYAANMSDDQDLLIVHGDADDNVHVQNTVIMADALIEEGKQFDLMIYPGRNHGIYGGTTRLHLFTMITDFITENL